MRYFPWLVAVHRDPVLDILLWQAMSSHEVVINMIEAFSPSLNSFLRKVNELGAEPTPEARLTIATDAANFEFRLESVNPID